LYGSVPFLISTRLYQNCEHNTFVVLHERRQGYSTALHVFHSCITRAATFVFKVRCGGVVQIGGLWAVRPQPAHLEIQRGTSLITSRKRYNEATERSPMDR
jgi:hypothetical protein